LRDFLGEEARSFSNAWRDKQLEYSFRRGLMQQYEDFSVCTAQALDYTCASFGLALTPEQKRDLLQAYTVLPAFTDVKPALAQVQRAGYKRVAFSNGTAKAVELLLASAGLSQYFDAIVSVEEIETFKPAPAVYRHLLKRCDAVAANTWLVSSNPFDVIGAVAAGLKAAWVRRSADAVFDPWGIEPTGVVDGLGDLQGLIGANLNPAG
jgi:2-haloacid dehalogenase